MIEILLGVWLGLALVWFLFWLGSAASRHPADLFGLLTWSLAWPVWVPYFAFLWIWGYRGG